MGSNLDTPPDSADLTGICSRCGRLSKCTLQGRILLIRQRRAQGIEVLIS